MFMEVRETTLPVNIIENLFCLSWRIIAIYVFFNPCDEVVFKSPFDDLVKDVQSYQLVYICSRKVFCKGLEEN